MENAVEIRDFAFFLRVSGTSGECFGDTMAAKWISRVISMKNAV